MTPETGVDTRKRPTRRDFLRYTAILSTGIITSLAILDVSGRQTALGLRPDSLTPELASDLDFIRSYYGLEIYTDISSLLRVFGREAQTISDEEIARSVGLIRQGLSVYPPEYFRRNAITGITLVAHLRSFGRELDGEAVYLDRDVIVNVARSRWLFLLTLYHELFHRTDFGSALSPKVGEFVRTSQRWDGLFQAQMNTMRDDWMEWYFEYGLGESIEDRAVHGAFLLIPSLHARLLLRCADEADLLRLIVIKEKIRQVKQLYLEWSDGKMNDRYWEDLLAGNVTEGYFSSSPGMI